MTSEHNLEWALERVKTFDSSKGLMPYQAGMLAMNAEIERLRGLLCDASPRVMETYPHLHPTPAHKATCPMCNPTKTVPELNQAYASLTSNLDASVALQWPETGWAAADNRREAAKVADLIKAQAEEIELLKRTYNQLFDAYKTLESKPDETSRCIHGRVVCEPCAQMAVRFHEKTIALAKEIYARHDRINKLLYSGAPGIMLGPMDSDAAHADRGALLSMLTPAQRGAVEPEPPPTLTQRLRDAGFERIRRDLPDDDLPEKASRKQCDVDGFACDSTQRCEKCPENGSAP